MFSTTIDYQLRYHAGLYERLAEEGWAVHVASSPGENLSRLSHVTGITTHALPMVRQPSPMRDMRALLQWIIILRANRPQVVLFGTPKASLLGLLAAWLSRVPHRVYEVHGLRLESATGIRRAPLVWLERLTCSLATQVVPVSNSLGKAIRGLRIAPACKITMLGRGSPNGVDIDHFRNARQDETVKSALRKQLGLDPARPVITFVGRVNEDKGITCLAEAVRLLHAAVPLQLLIVGAPDDSLGAAAITQLERDGLDVRLPGEVPDVAPYLAVSNALCLPSKREGLPTVILEAFAAGVPVVATAATGIVDLVTNNRTGYLVEIDDPVAMAEALQHAISQSQPSPCANRAAQFVVDHYCGEAVRERWRCFLEDMCAAE